MPLGGNRRSSARTYFNLVVVFFLCGLWHGASWTFVAWGLFHGTFLVVERLGLADWLRGTWRPIRHAYLLLVVMVGWVFFRADTFAMAAAMLRAMAGLGAGAPTAFTLQWYLTPELWLALAAGAIGSTPWMRALKPAPEGSWRLDLATTAGLLALLAASMMQVAARAYNPFIYFRF